MNFYYFNKDGKPVKEGIMRRKQDELTGITVWDL